MSADLAQLQPVVDAFDAADQPVLMVGGAVDQLGGWDDAIGLAELLQWRVSTAPVEGRPGFPEAHPLDQGQAAPGAFPLGRNSREPTSSS